MRRPSRLFGFIATTATPLPFSDATKGMNRVSAACEAGQWFERKTTIRNGESLKSARLYVLPSIPSSEKSGARSPILSAWKPGGVPPYSSSAASPVERGPARRASAMKPERGNLMPGQVARHCAPGQAERRAAAPAGLPAANLPPKVQQ